jgi:hypothetical protein
MIPQPATKLQELTERLNSLNLVGARNDLEVASIRHEVEKLIPALPARAYSLLGMLAAVQEDEPGMRIWFGNALKASPGDVELRLNFAAALVNAGFVSEARRTIGTTYRLETGNLEVLDYLISCTAWSMRFREASDLLRIRDALHSPRMHPMSDAIRSVHRFYASHSIDDDVAEQMLNVGFDVLHGAKVFRSRGLTEILEDEETAWVSCRIEIDRPLDIVIDLNDEFTSRIVAKEWPPEPLVLLVFMYTQMSFNGDHVS